MLTGFSAPLSPTGRSSLAPSPPWHYAGTVLAIEFRADPEVCAGWLPDGLVADESGYCVAHFADWQACTDDGCELDDPVRAQYREFFITIAATLVGEPVFLCPLIYVDQDVSLMRGHIQGLPKKLGAVHLTRAFGLDHPASPPTGPAGRFTGTLSVGGRRLAEGRIEADEDDARLLGFASRPMIGVRHFPDLTRRTRDRPLVHDFVRFTVRDRSNGPVIGGRGALRLASGPVDELGDFAPVGVGRAARFDIAFSIDDLESVHRPADVQP